MRGTAGIFTIYEIVAARIKSYSIISKIYPCIAIAVVIDILINSYVASHIKCIVWCRGADTDSIRLNIEYLRAAGA